jgi:hypothetical protein
MEAGQLVVTRQIGPAGAMVLDSGLGQSGARADDCHQHQHAEPFRTLSSQSHEGRFVGTSPKFKIQKRLAARTGIANESCQKE